METETDIIQNQIREWEERIVFLEQWIENLKTQAAPYKEDPSDEVKGYYYETMDKIDGLLLEVRAKRNVIDKRKRDIEILEARDKDIVEKLKGYPEMVTLLKRASHKLQPEHMSYFTGILERFEDTANKRSDIEVYGDYKLAQDLITYYKLSNKSNIIAKVT